MLGAAGPSTRSSLMRSAADAPLVVLDEAV